MHHPRLAALALTAAALIASGCGGSTKPSSGPATSSTQASPSTTATVRTAAHTQPLTRAELIAQGDAICRRVNAKRAASTVRNRGSQEFVRVLPSLVAFEQQAVTQMLALTPPASMAHSWKQMVTAAHTLTEVTSAAIGYARAGTLKQTQALAVVANKAMQQMLVTAAREGFKDCAQRTP